MWLRRIIGLDCAAVADHIREVVSAVLLAMENPKNIPMHTVDVSDLHHKLNAASV